MKLTDNGSGMKFPFKRCRLVGILTALFFVSCIDWMYDEPTYERTLLGSWARGDNQLSIAADSSFSAYCGGYCWARGGIEDNFSIIQDSLITFDYDGIYRFKVSSTGAEVRFYIYSSKLQVRDNFLVGLWERVSE